MAKTVTPESKRDAIVQMLADFNERWKEVNWDKLPEWKRQAIYRAMFYGGVQCEIVLDLTAPNGNVSMRMWVVGDYRSQALARLNRFAKKFLREYPVVTLTHQRIRLTEWGAATKKMLKDPYLASEMLDLILNTTAHGRALVKKKSKETIELKRILKKRGRKTLSESAKRRKVKPKPIPRHARDRVKLKIGIPEVFSAHTEDPVSRDGPPRADQLPFLPVMAAIRDIRTAYKPYLDLDSRRNRLHLAFDAMSKGGRTKRRKNGTGGKKWSSDVVHAAILKDRRKHSY